ncbi:hypothetical protein V8G54_008124 [Vigna mungo]|uniref:Ion transport domain-containing protein n=1 Tax=Vigna mungo TaxID=3915 RepID=A0AAQ3P518_VIGMU
MNEQSKNNKLRCHGLLCVAEGEYEDERETNWISEESGLRLDKVGMTDRESVGATEMKEKGLRGMRENIVMCILRVYHFRFYSDGKKHKKSLWGAAEPPALKPSNLLPLGKNRIIETFRISGSKVFPEDHEPWRKRILDPGSEIVLKWNRVFIVSCLVALFVDPLYFYLPSVIENTGSSCVRTDLTLRIVVTFLRTIADLFYLLHLIIKFRTAYVAPSSRVFGRGELVMDPKKIARRYFRSDFFIDFIATLPLPQMVIWFIIPATRSPQTDHKNNALALIVLLQYVPRLYLIFPLSSQIIKATGVVTKTAWAGAAYNLLLYMLASHVLGASWYLLSVDRYTTCLKSFCKKEQNPENCFGYLDCSSLNVELRKLWANSTNVFSSCDPNNKDINFKFGIFENAVKKHVVSSAFIPKYLYCLWWGLQQLRPIGKDYTGGIDPYTGLVAKSAHNMVCPFCEGVRIAVD